MKDLVIQNAEGYYWPKRDGNGVHDQPGSCWYGLKEHADVPENTAQYAEKHDILVQAGGNCGLYVKKYASLFKIVYTFEPDPVNFYCLNLNVTEPNVLKFQAALGRDHQGVAMGNFLPDVGATHVAGTGVIPTLRVDDLGLVACDMIHLDIEGYELRALEGAYDTITRYHPVIVLEYNAAWAARYNTTLADIENFLGNLGYAFFQNVPNGQGDRVYKYKAIQPTKAWVIPTDSRFDFSGSA